MPPDFRFCPPPPPPDFFLAPPTVFFWEEEVGVFGRKKVKICDFGQKKPSDFGENLCPPDLNFAPPDLAKLATPLG